MSFFDPFMVGRPLDPPPMFYRGVVITLTIKTRTLTITLKRRSIEVELI